MSVIASIVAPQTLHRWHRRVIAEQYDSNHIQFIRELGNSSGWREARTQILTFQEENRAKGGSWRNGLRLRVSGRKVADLAQRFFADERRKNTGL